MQARDAARRAAVHAAPLIAGIAGLHHRLRDGPEAAGNAFLHRLCGGAAGAGRQTAKQQAARLVGGRHRRASSGFALFGALLDAAHAGHLTGNPLFPYFNEYFHSPLALAAPYRDLRFRAARISGAQLFFPVLFSIDWHVADDLGFQDIRVCLAYFAGDRGVRAVAAAPRRAAIRWSTRASRCRCSPSPPSPMSSGCRSSPSIATSSRWRCWRRC